MSELVTRREQTATELQLLEQLEQARRGFKTMELRAEKAERRTRDLALENARLRRGLAENR